MNKLRKEYLLNLIEKEITKAELATRATQDSALVLKKASPSQAGDRYHAEAASSIAKEYLARLRNLQEEISKSPDKIYTRVKPISFVELFYENSEKVEFYFVKNGALLPEALLITLDSPLGASIEGKKLWDNFSYEVDKGNKRASYSGRIINIE